MKSIEEEPLEIKPVAGKITKAQFVLAGFTHDTGFRVYAFECMGLDRVWTKSSVRADLSLARKYGISLQDLPLLCRGVLDRCDPNPGGQALTFSEEEMRVCSTERTAAREEAAKRKKPAYRPSPNGRTWEANAAPGSLSFNRNFTGNPQQTPVFAPETPKATPADE